MWCEGVWCVSVGVEAGCQLRLEVSSFTMGTG